MKTKLLLLLSFLLIQVSLFGVSGKKDTSIATVIKEIKFKHKPIHRPQRSVPLMPTAFINGSQITISLSPLVSSATISVTNLFTGEIIYSSICVGNTEDTVIDLSAKLVEGQYRLEMICDSMLFSGDFSINQ